MNNDVRLLLVDGHALVHRAFHAIQALSTSAGELTNAVFGFANVLLKEVGDLKPTHVIMAMDRAAPTFRHDAYAEYKATRPKTPSELKSQFQRVRQVAEAMNIAIYERDGFEADDILGTLARQAQEAGVDTIILTGDLDALQLAGERVRILTPARGIGETKLYDMAAVRERYGLNPEQIPDWKALVGDTSDNIPGVRGIGPKAAEELLQQFGTIEGIYLHLDDIPPKRRDLLAPHLEQARHSKLLATIVRDVPESLDLEHCAWQDVDRVRLLSLFSELEFYSLIERYRDMFPRQAVASPAPLSSSDRPPTQLSMFAAADTAERDESAAAAEVPSLHSLLSIPVGNQSETRTTIVRDAESLARLCEVLTGAEIMAVDTETTSTDPLHAKLVGLSFSVEPKSGWYVPVGHVEGEQLPLEEVLETLRSFLEDDSKLKVGHNIKYDLQVLHQHGVVLKGVSADTMVAAYLVDASGRGLSLDTLALGRLGVEMVPIEALIGKGKNQITMDHVSIEAVAPYAAEDADVTLRLWQSLQPELAANDVEDLFHKVEMPLVSVLAHMEEIGVGLDSNVLLQMSSQMTESIGRLEGQIYEHAGRRFNINSTQQLGQLLFVELGLRSGRRTKTGYSTDNEVLERLRGAHPIVDDLLEYRGLIKLRNTYVDALPLLRDPRTGKVHTDFNQCAVATGRLSSSNPNLQNIPIRGDLGRTIRRAFVPSSTDHVLRAADYSQIELRILASMSGDERLTSAFNGGEDVHRATASAVFGVPIEDVTPDQRRIAKTVNFGIIYGIGEVRLAFEAGITRDEAHAFIASYNQTYAGVKGLMDDLRKRAALYGYVTTLLHRRRYIRDIHSPNPGIRAAAERAAINMPIQGTAADIIKLAMIRLHDELQSQFQDAHMVLQVHDELVFDVPRRQVDEVAALVQAAMVNALPLSVPLEVEMKAGPDWYDMVPVTPGVTSVSTA